MAGPRPTWKGLLKIALVQIPIKVFPATESSGTVSFNQLHSTCQARVTQKKWCGTCDREVPSAEIEKGFEFEKGRYVILHEAELDAVQPDSTRVIDLVRVSALATLPYTAIDRAYYLAPDGPDGGPACTAYAVVLDALLDQVALGTLAIYGREYLVAVTARDRSLVLYTLHHAGEIREAPYVVDFTQLDPEERRLARRVVASFRAPLDLAAFTDTYQADLRRLIAAKIAGQEIVVPPVAEAAPPISLHEALTRSLAVRPEKKRMAKASRDPIQPGSRTARRRRIETP